MKTPVRLRVTLVDSHSALVPNSADKILYASEEVTTVKEICNDVREKLGLSQSSYDVQLWSDDYLVPDWTSTTVFQRDEIVQLRIFPTGHSKSRQKRSRTTSLTATSTNSSVTEEIPAKKPKIIVKPPEKPTAAVKLPETVIISKQKTAREKPKASANRGHKYFDQSDSEGKIVISTNSSRSAAISSGKLGLETDEGKAAGISPKKIVDKQQSADTFVSKSDWNPFVLSKSHLPTTCAQLPGKNRKFGPPPVVFYRNKPTGTGTGANSVPIPAEPSWNSQSRRDEWQNHSIVIQNEEENEDNSLVSTCDNVNVVVVKRKILEEKSMGKSLVICRHPDSYATLKHFLLQNGDIFSYKTLELGPDFSPQISGWKFVKISENEANKPESFTAIPLYCVAMDGNKYELFEPIGDPAEHVELQWNGLFEPKLIQD